MNESLFIFLLLEADGYVEMLSCLKICFYFDDPLAVYSYKSSRVWIRKGQSSVDGER